jgi:PPM family protein phosphatase
LGAAKFVTGEKMTENYFQIDSASISDRGLSKKRPQNEDSFLELTERGLFVVADGVGGAQAGDVASQMAVEILGEAFINLQKNGDAEDIMRIAIERANEAIFQMSHDLAQLSTMATTIVALHIAGNIATIGHVGDSRIYRLDPKGSLFRETQDHSVVEEEVRAGRMTQEQAANHPSRNVISRALGAEHSVEVDMKTIMIEPNTTFLLCSDGITRHIDDFQLREILLFNDTPANLCQRMKEICYERGAEDNLTAVIARVTEVGIENLRVGKTKTPEDYEEATVAAARPSTAADMVVPQTLIEEETPTQPLVMPQINEPQTSEPVPVNETSAPIVTNERIAFEPQAEISNVTAEKLDYSERADNEHTSSGKMSHLLSYFLFLVLGGLIGAGIYYFFTQNNQPAQVPQLTQMQSPNIEFSSFETLRRSVDNDPNSFINKNSNTTLDAESLYLLGRAYLLTGKSQEAKKNFEEARNKLGQSNLVNSKVLMNDIAMGLSIVEESAAQIKFQNQTNTGKNHTNSNTINQ